MPKTAAVRRPPAEQFLHWLCLAARRTRETAGATSLQVALLADLRTDATVKRFEQGKHWPVDPETLIAAYARACRVEDPRSIYELALDLWYEQGKAPGLNPKSPGVMFEEAFNPPTPTAEPRGPRRNAPPTPKKRADS
jgi:hypothetical protein